ncbi:transposase [Gluconacetobacter asukensis]|uniref:Transposase n=1 Tax=Gluconacetobacter asukensis TaxID=1017181 RepID=A0A7W4IXH2_9PROT|nr:hypothetical protein [Gluconacetobacter asukensis]
MARALSDDLRVRVLEAGAAGGSARSVAKRFGIGISTAIRWLRRERENGERVVRLRGRALQAYVEHVLVPTLSPGDLVVLDHLPAHMIPRARKAIEQAGARLMFPPPYSPDFNPVEMAFAKLKALLRAKAARTVTALWDAAGSVLDAFTPDECANFFTAAGYEPE